MTDAEYDFHRKIGQALRAYRGFTGCSQQEIADVLGVKRQTVSKYEGGAPMPLYSLHLLAHPMRYDLPELIWDAIRPQPTNPDPPR